MARRRVRRGLPALTEHRWLRFAALAALYLGQGLPEGLLYIAVPAWLAEQRVSAAEIGSYVAVIWLPWNIKLLNGPVMDRWTFLPMGRRRSWILAAQAALIASLVALFAMPDPATHLAILMALGFMVNFCAAFQDVAVDGMAIDILAENEQARANGLMWGSKTIGMSAGAGMSGILIALWGLDAAIGVLVLAMGVIMLFPLLLRERPGERILPWTRGAASPVARQLQRHDWTSIGRDLLGAVITRKSVIFMLLTFVALMVYDLDTAGLPPLAVQDLEWPQERFTTLAMWAGISAGLFGMIVGGPLIDRVGPARVLAVTLVLAATIHFTMALIPSHWNDESVIETYMVIYGMVFVALTVALYALAMRLCEKHVAATQFAVYMAFVNLGSVAGAAALGLLLSGGGYSLVFAVMGTISATALGLLLVFKLVIRNENRLY